MYGNNSPQEENSVAHYCSSANLADAAKELVEYVIMNLQGYEFTKFLELNQNGNPTDRVTDKIVSTSTVDIDEVFGEGNYEAEFSDLVADILGNALMYWTRDVGSELNNAECITKYGTVIQAKMQNLLGARITTNVKTFACV